MTDTPTPPPTPPTDPFAVIDALLLDYAETERRLGQLRGQRAGLIRDLERAWGWGDLGTRAVLSLDGPPVLAFIRAFPVFHGEGKRRGHSIRHRVEAFAVDAIYPKSEKVTP